MKKIFLYKGRGKDKKVTDVFALVDDADYEYLMQWKWGYMKLYHCDSSVLYANRYERLDGKTTAFLMHREIMNASSREQKCDHTNGDTLDNRRENLRICTHSQNMSNRTKKCVTKSKYLGILFVKKINKWYASVKHNNVVHRSGCFEKEEDAANAYNEIAFKLKGEYAKLNLL